MTHINSYKTQEQAKYAIEYYAKKYGIYAEQVENHPLLVEIFYEKSTSLPITLHLTERKPYLVDDYYLVRSSN